MKKITVVTNGDVSHYEDENPVVTRDSDTGTIEVQGKKVYILVSLSNLDSLVVENKDL